ncbi:PREDICTED: zinc finger protein 516 [Elephantulus edwardii]|uniref:zinc finger protein 516 n=1 Tax=Elephantulus edwardii TaxID=28737 RepID=UPI0003F0AF01|nr:PREDICTED: zinc finger protein 516 [Elephantulus edwardii]
MDRNRDADMELRRGPEVDGDKVACHSCCICGKSFPFQSSLSQHMRKHTGEKPYRCPYCDHRASQKGNLKIHIRSHRTGTLVQGREPEAAEAPPGELRVSEGLDGCASPTKSSSACNKMLNGATADGKVLLRSGRKDGATAGEGAALAHCPFCKSAFESARGLERHLQHAHRPFRCRLCRFMALREEALLSHVEKEHITAQGPGGTEAAADNGRELPAGEFPCEVCGQAFSQTWFLKAHMKKHRGSFDHGCHICGRRFKEPWFLKNHMKAHGPRAASKNRQLDPIATINNVVQEETIVTGLSLYEVCTKCGNLFTNLDSLSAHNAVHRRAEVGRTQGGEPGPIDAQTHFLQCLSLRPAGRGDAWASAAGRRVAELDPVSSYQAWQLATRGKVAEPAEYLKYGAWDEAAGGVDGAGERARREFVDSASGPSSPGSASAADDSPGSGLADDAADDSGDEGVLEPGRGPSRRLLGEQALAVPVGEEQVGMLTLASLNSFQVGVSACVQPVAGAGPCVVCLIWAFREASELGLDLGPKSSHRGSPKEAPAALTSAGQSHAFGDHVSGIPAPVSFLESSGREASRRPDAHRFSLDLKMPALHSKPEGLDSTTGCLASMDSPLPPDRLARPRLDKAPLDAAGREPPGGAPHSPEPGPLDLSARSSRGTRGREAACALRAALPVHPCPYCSHHSYYPEVLWMHKRVWHRVSGSAVAPPWVQPNGCRSIKNHLVFLARNGRTGPPPALGGKECQPLPVARFARTQGPASRGGSSPLLGIATKAPGMPRAKEGTPGAPCEPWAHSPDGQHQAWSGPSPGQSAPRVPPARPKPEPQPTAGGGLSRSATPTPSVITRAGPLVPTRLAEKQGTPPAVPSPGPPTKHSAPDSTKAKFSPSPPCQPPSKADGGSPLPPQELASKATPEPRTPGGVAARGSTAVQAQPSAAGAPPEHCVVKPEPATEGQEKPLDILNIFKTYIPKDLATLYQSWGSSGPALEHRGPLGVPARQADLECSECGKSFAQPAHLRAHTRAHTVLFESNGLRVADVHGASASSPKQIGGATIAHSQPRCAVWRAVRAPKAKVRGVQTLDERDVCVDKRRREGPHAQD